MKTAGTDDVELIGGYEKRPVRVVDPDPARPSCFDEEYTRISAALGSLAHRIGHIGSTAVAGLAARPVIDIDVSVPDVEAEPPTSAPSSRRGTDCASARRAIAWCAPRNGTFTYTSAGRWQCLGTVAPALP